MKNIFEEIKELHGEYPCSCSEKCEFIESIKTMLKYDSIESQREDIRNGNICICGNNLKKDK